MIPTQIVIAYFDVILMTSFITTFIYHKQLEIVIEIFITRWLENK